MLGKLVLDREGIDIDHDFCLLLGIVPFRLKVYADLDVL